MAGPQGSGRKDAFLNEDGSGANADGLVDLQDGDCNAAHGGQADQAGTVPSEVRVPYVGAGVEEWGKVAGEGVEAGDVRPFVGVAVEAGEGQVFEDGFAAVLAGDDVVRVEGLVVEGGGD